MNRQVKKSRAEGQRLAEAIEINRGLMVLGRVIDALVAQRPHVPYYESKLTMLAQPALGGNARTAVRRRGGQEGASFKNGEAKLVN